MARVSLESVSKSFAGVNAVQNLSLEVQDHEFLVLVGPSGCGKSTTLRLIAGLERATSGTVCIGGQDVGKVAARHRNIALVFQSHPLYPQLTVGGNLAFGLRQAAKGEWPASIWNWWARLFAVGSASKRDRVSAQVREAARGLGVEHLLDRLPRQLSGGERQRVALGRAIVRNPAVFLLDEPLSNLDANLRIEMRRVVRQVHNQSRAATIYVTHDQAEALAMADRVAVIQNGSLQQVGTPQEVYDRPANTFVAGFIGNPPMNVFAGKFIEREGRWSVAGVGLEIELTNQEVGGEALASLRGKDVVCGLRAEYLELVRNTAVNGGSVPARVWGVEYLGAESWIYVGSSHSEAGSFGHENRHKIPEKSASSRLVAKTNLSTALQPGEVVVLRCAARHAHWFDPRSGERLT